jgi:hypothetical protein
MLIAALALVCGAASALAQNLSAAELEQRVHQMLQWTVAGFGARFAGIVHHTDAEREWAYDRTSRIRKLDKA